MAHVNINFIRLPTLEKLKIGVQVSFVLGTYFADGIMVAGQKRKARCVFQENNSVFLKCSKIHMDIEGICISKHEERLPQENL